MCTAKHRLALLPLKRCAPSRPSLALKVLVGCISVLMTPKFTASPANQNSSAVKQANSCFSWSQSSMGTLQHVYLHWCWFPLLPVDWRSTLIDSSAAWQALEAANLNYWENKAPTNGKGTVNLKADLEDRTSDERCGNWDAMSASDNSYRISSESCKLNGLLISSLSSEANIFLLDRVEIC